MWIPELQIYSCSVRILRKLFEHSVLKALSDFQIFQEFLTNSIHFELLVLPLSSLLTGLPTSWNSFTNDGSVAVCYLCP